MSPVTTPQRPEVHIRRGDATDAALLADLAARTFRDTYLDQNRPEDVDAHVAAAHRPDVLAQDLASAAQDWFVAEVEDGPVGFASLRRDEVKPGVEARDPVLLTQLYVDRPYQSVGVGAALLGRCLELARSRGHDVMAVTVWEHNERAQAAYRRWGFRHVGEESFLLGTQRQRDLVLVLPLDSVAAPDRGDAGGHEPGP